MTAKKKETTNEETTAKVTATDAETTETPVTPDVKVAPEVPKETGDAEVAASTEASKSLADKTVEELADEVDAGAYGSGRERMLLLGSRYVEVQREVNKRFREREQNPSK